MTSAPRAIETQYEDTIVEAAMLAGWLVHCERAARTNKGHRTAIKGHAGWPDVVLAGFGRFVVIELKRKPNKPSDEQLRWIATLTAAGVDASVRYVPEELDSILALISSRGSQ